jgi:hypothetical protein
MATADDVVQLPVSQFEEALGFPIGVIFQAQRTQYWILESHRDWRALTAHCVAVFSLQMLGASQGCQASLGMFC